MNNIRLLNNDEIEVRVQSYNERTGKAIFLLYKDARCDMKILDEVFGFDGWEREHQLIDGKLFCTVRVWSDRRNAWISKQDVGTESNTEKEKGQASDSFKRACFNLGIGRELYTAPLISIQCSDKDLYNNKCSLKLEVKHIAYNANREISELILVDRFGNERFSWKNGKTTVTNNTSVVEKVAVTNNTEGVIVEANEKPVKVDERLITADQNKRIYAIAKVAKVAEADILKFIEKEFGVKKTTELNRTQYKVLSDRLEAKKQKVLEAEEKGE